MIPVLAVKVIVSAVFVILSWGTARAVTGASSTEVYRWVKVEYDWPNDTMKKDFVESGKFVVENNIIAGIKVYGDEVYLTVPRWFPGVPSTLNKVVMKNGSPVLQPYPSWSDQTLGDCTCLQFVQSMELDPNTGYMWIIDNGRVDIMENTSRNLCPPKLVIHDTLQNREVRRHTFPTDIADPSTCYLNDLALDYVDGRAKFAYITDIAEIKLFVYDYEADRSYFFQDPTMNPTIGNNYQYNAIDGIAMSPRFDYLYYCPVDGYGLFQIPTTVLRHSNAPFSQHVRRVGTRPSRSGGLTYGQRTLYYGMLDATGVNYWSVDHDAGGAGGYAHVTMMTQGPLVRDDVKMRFADTLAMDDSDHLWFTANNLRQFLNRTMDFSGRSGPNMFVWKVMVNESSYLAGAASRPGTTTPGIIG